MEAIYQWLGDLYKVEYLGRELTGLIVILSSVVCGTLVGVERERNDKPAGMRTVILICVGSTIFTMAGILLASDKNMADPARIASQIVPGIGFLGAGAIIQLRGSVQGLTTGATIWAVAAVGVIVGSGYVAAGLGFTMIIIATLSLFRTLESLVVGRCVNSAVLVRYRTNNGKGRARLQSVFDGYQIPDDRILESDGESEGERQIALTYCCFHRDHRSILKDLADLEEVVSLSTNKQAESDLVSVEE